MCTMLKSRKEFFFSRSQDPKLCVSLLERENINKYRSFLCGKITQLLHFCVYLHGICFSVWY